MNKAFPIHQEEGHLEEVKDLSIVEAKGAELSIDASQEHQLTVREIWKNHKQLMAWAFFWAMCAIGWGFDAQVNGAMISGKLGEWLKRERS